MQACRHWAVGLRSESHKGHSREGESRRYVVRALLAGSAFGAFFILIDSAGADAGHWPLIASRLAALVTLVTFSLVVGSPLRPDGARAAKLRRRVAWIWVATCFSYSPSIVACCLW